jgi:hypothetical protein
MEVELMGTEQEKVGAGPRTRRPCIWSQTGFPELSRLPACFCTALCAYRDFPLATWNLWLA